MGGVYAPKQSEYRHLVIMVTLLFTAVIAFGDTGKPAVPQATLLKQSSESFRAVAAKVGPAKADGHAAAPLIPETTENRSEYLKRAASSLDRWQGIIEGLKQAEDVAPQLSQERQAIMNARSDLDRTEQELVAQWDVLKVADEKSWPGLKSGMQRGFHLMKQRFDRLAAR